MLKLPSLWEASMQLSKKVMFKREGVSCLK